jgi:hypothetical protein
MKNSINEKHRGKHHQYSRSNRKKEYQRLKMRSGIVTFNQQLRK